MPNPIETDFKLALALGRLAGRWGQAEIGVEMIYTTLSEMPYRKAIISFSFHKSVATQRDIISHLADETTWIAEELRAEIKSSLKEFVDKSAKRNGWIHFPFGVSTADGTDEIYKMTRARKGDVLYSKTPASHKLITEFADEVSELTSRLYRAHGLLTLSYENKLAAQRHDHSPQGLSSRLHDIQALLAVPAPRFQSSKD
ncbi:MULTISPECIES: hypothetical protein [unclassified Shinella]|uniref:hypothetical protein n=1 Tax=unclassified Shinella TaxID=2643062 RepID=UPI00234F6BFF|nr:MULTISPECIES: hypothetical protein [unclassified Shinella]MCO5150410.1 hypothetical protein [Shinella sp.]MDC7261357.1 hypothetical protein [Shinella sp. HY16]MDC7268252.1 hypothetical protein [Shinella sp. YZ44]